MNVYRGHAETGEERVARQRKKLREACVRAVAAQKSAKKQRVGKAPRKQYVQTTLTVKKAVKKKQTAVTATTLRWEPSEWVWL
jgi:hypothetical protein